jgi:hypothetical protein
MTWVFAARSAAAGPGSFEYQYTGDVFRSTLYIFKYVCSMKWLRVLEGYKEETKRNVGQCSLQ